MPGYHPEGIANHALRPVRRKIDPFNGSEKKIWNFSGLWSGEGNNGKVIGKVTSKLETNLTLYSRAGMK